MKPIIAVGLLLALVINTSALNASQSPVAASKEKGPLRTADAEIFAAETAKIAPGSDIAEALEAQSNYFIGQFREATKSQFEKAVEKSKELNKKRIDAASSVKPATRRNPRVYGKSDLGERIIDLIESSKITVDSPSIFAQDGPHVDEIETENGFKSTSTDRKSIDLPETTATRTQVVNSEVGFDGKNTMTKSMGTEETVETASKVNGHKVTKTSKTSTRVSFELCPDFAGIVRGTGTMRFFSQTTVNTGKQLAALTTDFTVDYRITGHVNDEAEMTHFDLKANAIEKTTGFDRALRLDLVTSTNGVQDGTRSMFVEFNGNTPPRSVPSEYGGTKTLDSELSEAVFKPLATNSDADNTRLAGAALLASHAFVIDLDLLMRSSISRWQNYECVSVKCTALTTLLAPKESVEVNAVSISTLDQTKFNAKMKASGTESVTPGDQEGKPSADYMLTAPEKGKALLIVKSISRRGIGLEVLEIPVAEAKKKPPVKKIPPSTKKCDQGWAGTVKAVRRYQKLDRGKADGRLLREVRTVESSYNIEVSLTGTRDTSGGIVNNFHGNARADYSKEENRERMYASGRMSCGQRIIESPETQKNILNYKGDASGQILVAIAVNGNQGHIDFSPPAMQASFTHNYIYETACPAYDQVNSKIVRSDDLQDVTESFFEVDFEIDPSTPNILSGSKTVLESDGSEVTYTWNLSRCQ